MKLTVLLALLFAASTASTQKPRFCRVESTGNDSIPTYIQFFCTQGYDLATVRKVLAPYFLQLLGERSFYLALAPDWEPSAQSDGGPAVSPAFPLLSKAVADHTMSYASADRNVEVHLKPEIIDAMLLAWTKAGAGVSRSEAGFYVGSDGSITAGDRTNQDGALQFIIPAGTTAIFHTHPQGHDRMSQQDMVVADKGNLDMYVISHSGLYHYRPGMKGPEMLQAGTDYLTKKKANK